MPQAVRDTQDKWWGTQKQGKGTGNKCRRGCWFLRVYQSLLAIWQHLHKLTGWGQAKQSAHRLRPGARISIAVHGLFILGIALSNTFVNIYIFKVGESFKPLATYHIFQYLAIPTGFLLAGYVAEKWDRTHALRIGVGLHGIFYALVLYLGPATIHNIHFLGFLLGTATGFYYLGSGVLSYDLTSDGNTEYYTGVQGTVAGMDNMIAPFIAGWIIVSVPKLTGYRIIFTVSLVLFAATTWISRYLYNRPSSGEFSPLILMQPNFNPHWKPVMVTHFLNGVRGGSLAFLVGVMVYISTGTELGLGTFALVTSIIGLISTYLVGKQVERTARARFMRTGVRWMTLSTLILAAIPGTVGLILFGLIEAAFASFYNIPFSALQFEIMDGDKAHHEHRVEYITVRELPLNFGRLVSVIIFLLFVPYIKEPVAFAGFLFILTISHMAGWYVLGPVAVQHSGPTS